MDIIGYFDHENNDEFIQAGDHLISQKKQIRIPIANKIPRFTQNDNYADSFGLQWNTFRKTQLDSFTGFNSSRKRLDRCLDGNLVSLKNKIVLEIGCGAGRFTEILLDVGARVISTDLSCAVDANAENFPVSENHQIAQCDVNNLPFKPGQFDAVICLGVIQHTPDPRTTILDLISACKPGGLIVFDQYVSSLYRMVNIGRVFRFVLKNFSPKLRFAIIKKIVGIYHPLHASPIFKKMPLCHLLTLLSPCASFYRSMPELPEDLQYSWMLLDTHDTLTDYYKHLTSLKEMRGFCESLPEKNLRVMEGGNGVEVLLRKT